MSTEQNKLLLRSFLEKLDKDLTGVDDLCEAEFVAHLPGSPKPVDRDGFKQFVSQFYAAFPDLHHEVEDQIAEDDRVVSRVTVRGTHQGSFRGIPPEGRQIAITDIIIIRMKDEKAAELWAQFDALGLMEQLGVFHLSG